MTHFLKSLLCHYPAYLYKTHSAFDLCFQLGTIAQDVGLHFTRRFSRCQGRNSFLLKREENLGARESQSDTVWLFLLMQSQRRFFLLLTKIKSRLSSLIWPRIPFSLVQLSTLNYWPGFSGKKGQLFHSPLAVFFTVACPNHSFKVWRRAVDFLGWAIHMKVLFSHCQAYKGKRIRWENKI